LAKNHTLNGELELPMFRKDEEHTFGAKNSGIVLEERDFMIRPNERV